MRKSQVIIGSILITYLVFSIAFFFTLFDKSFYNKTFMETGVYEELGVEGVRSTVDYLIKYLTSESTNDQGLQLFFPKERYHLADVKKIVLAVKYLSIASVIGLLVIFYFTKNRKDLAKQTLLYGSIGVVATIIIIGLLSINFAWFWDNFHKILFPQGNYTFPADHLLIKLFPEHFFRGFTLKVIINALILSALLLGSYWLMRLKK